MLPFIIYNYSYSSYFVKPRRKSTPGILYDDALASIPRSLTGLIYQKRSLPSARQFVHAYFLSRQVDIRSMLKFVEPKRALLEMVKKYNREPPKSRYLLRYTSVLLYPSDTFKDCSKRRVVTPIHRSLL